MDDEELLALIRSESDRVERKESLTERVREAICAFANDLPGHQKPAVVVVGQRDDRTCANLPIDDRLLSTLAGYRVESNFAPFPSIDVRALTIDGCAVAVVVVHPASSPPVRYAGRIWVRVGPTRRVATPEEERRLTERRRAAHLPFDVQPVPAATLADLDLEHFSGAKVKAKGPSEDRHCLGLLKRYGSLMPMAQEARKPIFHLKPADGALGAHAAAARDARADFKRVAERIAQSTWLPKPPR